MDKAEPKRLFTLPKKCEECKKIICRCLMDAHFKKQEEIKKQEENKKNNVKVVDHLKI